MIELADNADRLKALNDFNHSICIEAGAGTGKTTVLVGRLVNFIKQGLGSISDLVAITFTDKAAGELKQRLQAELVKANAEARTNGDSEVFERLTAALKGLDTAQISTIHSFASSILKEYPVEAGIDPRYQQLDGISANEFFDELWDTWLDDRLSETCIPLKTYLELGGNLDQIRKLAYYTITDDDGLLNVVSPNNSFDSLWAEFREAVYELRSYANDCILQSDPGFCQISRLIAYYEMLESADTSDRRRILATHPLKVSKSAGLQGNWRPKDTLKSCKLLFASISECLNEMTNTVKGTALSDLYHLMKQFRVYFNSEKSARGVVDFNDLLKLTRDLIRDNFKVRAELQKRFKHILIDEFQDTDPLQAEIAFFLCEETPLAEDWQQVILEPGKLFIVGDPKQSIYRFRKADIEIYELARAKIEEAGLALKIVQNFRTVNPILDWVNTAFGNIMTVPADGNYQPEYIALQGVREGGSSNLWVIGEPDLALKDGESSSVEDVRKLEASYIASAISDLVRNELVSIESRDSSCRRPVRYGDIAILFPTRSEIDIYEEALRVFDIPYTMDGGKRYFARQEVNSLIAGLRAISNPHDEVNLVAVLRSSFFGVPDDILFNHKAHGGQFNYIKPWAANETEIASELSAAFKVLAELHGQRHSLSISSLVEVFLERTKAVEIQLTRTGGRQAASNLMKIVGLARDYNSSTQSTLASFIDWLSDRRDKEIAEAESPTFEISDDVVQLMTIHKSKGLEFPVVFLANLATVPDGTSSFIQMKKEGRIEIKLGSKKDGFITPNYTDGEIWESKRAKAEDVRLLYVAATRARDLLVIPNFIERKESYLSTLQTFLNSVYKFEPSMKMSPRDAMNRDQTDLGELISARKLWAIKRECTISDASKPVALVRPSAHDIDPSYDPLSDTTESIVSHEASGRGATLGTLFHNTMELLDFGRVDIITERDIKTLVTRVAKSQGTEDLVDRTAHLVSKCLAMPVMAKVKHAEHIYKEVPFAVSFADGQLCEGKIDLIYSDTDGTYVIIDYKTDSVDSNQVDNRFDTYKEQGSIYLKALSLILPGQVKRIDFVFVSPGEVRSISL